MSNKVSPRHSVAVEAALIIEIIKRSPEAMEAIAASCPSSLIPTGMLPAFYAVLTGERSVAITTNNLHPASPRDHRVFQLWLEDGSIRWRWISPYTSPKVSPRRDIAALSIKEKTIYLSGSRLSAISGGVPLHNMPLHSVPLSYIPGD